MQKSIEVAKKISKILDSDSTELLFEYNLRNSFESIFSMGLDTKTCNCLVCAIIFSYDADSNWCDLKKTSYEDKTNILKGLKADLDNPIFDEFINLSNEEINNSIGDFLDLQTDWRYAQIMRSRDYHSKAIKTKQPEFTGVDDDKTIKAVEGIGKLLREGLNHRKIADEYTKQIEGDYVRLNHRTEQDFGVKFTDTQTKVDPMSWRAFIKETKPLWEAKRKQENSN